MRAKAFAILLVMWCIAVLLRANVIVYLPLGLATVALLLDRFVAGQQETRPERHVL
jgi:hypothetical protein